MGSSEPPLDPPLIYFEILSHIGFSKQRQKCCKFTLTGFAGNLLKNVAGYG